MEMDIAKILRKGKGFFVFAGFMVSGAGEFHPRALSELDMNLSAHPAPITQLMV